MRYENIINDWLTKMIETRDEFIFQTISSWIVDNYQITVSKEMLSKAVALIKMMSTCVDTEKVIKRVAM